MVATNVVVATSTLSSASSSKHLEKSKSMKTKLFRLVATISLAVVACLGAYAQQGNGVSYALIDMQYLTEKIPQYKSASQQIEKETQKWTNEINKLSEQAKQLYIKYQQEAAQLSQEQRIQRENAIVAVEEQAAELQKKYFGRTGEVAKLQEKLIKPIQDAIYEAVKLISQRRGYLMVLDRASSVGTIVYADPQADISNDVLAVLGISE